MGVVQIETGAYKWALSGLKLVSIVGVEWIDTGPYKWALNGLKLEPIASRCPDCN